MVRIVNGVIVREEGDSAANVLTTPSVHSFAIPQQPYQYQHFEQLQQQQQNDQPTLTTSFNESLKRGSFNFFGRGVPLWAIILGALAAYLVFGFRGLLAFIGLALICFYFSHNSNHFNWVSPSDQIQQSDDNSNNIISVTVIPTENVNNNNNQLNNNNN